MANQDTVDASREVESNLKTVAEEAGQTYTNLFQPWDDDEPFIDPRHHLVPGYVRDTVPNAGDLDKGAIELGDGTGPNGRDEIFWSVDGDTVARVEADSIIS